MGWAGRHRRVAFGACAKSLMGGLYFIVTVNREANLEYTNSSSDLYFIINSLFHTLHLLVTLS
jgi:hypothetical protein